MDQKQALEAVQDFGTAYYFLMRIRIANAESLLRAINSGKVRNGVLLELMYGYVQVAASEFALNLYDVIDLLKKLDPAYKYPVGGAIERVIRFRRSMVAHRGKNWSSKESQETQAMLEADANSIFIHSKAAIKEFCDALAARNISFGPTLNRPVSQLIRPSDLDELLKNAPDLGNFVPVPSDNELDLFFGQGGK